MKTVEADSFEVRQTLSFEIEWTCPHCVFGNWDTVTWPINVHRLRCLYCNKISKVKCEDEVS